MRPGNFVALPNQNVDLNGFITVPYAGAVKANGRTPSEIQQDIVKAIGNRAIEPQVVVSLITQNTSLVSVLGEVRQPARLTANAAGERFEFPFMVPVGDNEQVQLQTALAGFWSEIGVRTTFQNASA